MATGYHVDMNRRYGGHGGYETEWEITTKTTSLDRVKKLEALDLRQLVVFHYSDYTNGFCVLRGHDELAYLCAQYLSMWPDFEGEAVLLERIKQTGQNPSCLSLGQEVYLKSGTVCEVLGTYIGGGSRKVWARAKDGSWGPGTLDRNTVLTEPLKEPREVPDYNLLRERLKAADLCPTHNLADAFALIEKHGHTVDWVLAHPKWLQYFPDHPAFECRENTLGMIWWAQVSVLWGVPEDRFYLFTDFFRRGGGDLTHAVQLDLGPHLRLKQGVHFEFTIV